MKLIFLPLLLGTLVGCNLFNPDEVEPEGDFPAFAHGMWLAESGDIDISSGPGFLVYDWYAIDTIGVDSSVSVTWDDGLSCTITAASFEGNKVVLTVWEYTWELKIVDSDHITATFSAPDEHYVKYLIKQKDDPSVLCF